MSTIDQFESVFRSAVKTAYKHDDISIGYVVIVTDLNGDEATAFGRQVERLLGDMPVARYELVTGDRYASTIDLLRLLESSPADLICCYRNLHSRAWQYPHSLGSHLDVIIQKTAPPVLILPHPQAGYAYERAYDGDRRVLAMTDHMTDDNVLINYAAHFAGHDGYLHLAHIEDEYAFTRYIDAIGKIETIDTENAAATIRRQLLKSPGEYIESCRAVLNEKYPSLTIESTVAFGRRPADYLQYVEDLRINLLVLHGTYQQQPAMHGVSYPLAIELRQIPVLII